jgi:hypothetical protein
MSFLQDFKTVNEQRSDQGLPPIDSGDVLPELDVLGCAIKEKHRKMVSELERVAELIAPGKHNKNLRKRCVELACIERGIDYKRVKTKTEK